MRIALPLLLALLPACDASHARTLRQNPPPTSKVEGRYQLEIMGEKDRLYLVDTQTGEVWLRIDEHWSPHVGALKPN